MLLVWMATNSNSDLHRLSLPLMSANPFKGRRACTLMRWAGLSPVLRMVYTVMQELPERLLSCLGSTL